LLTGLVLLQIKCNFRFVLLQIIVIIGFVLCLFCIFAVVNILEMTYFKRHIFQNLMQWKENPDRKPLILRGARQVGKTTLIQLFAKTYKNQIFLNLDRASDLNFINKYNDAKTLTEALFIMNNLLPDEKRDTLLFIDEIQESEQAISMLRYFYEDIPELHVIAAGSLLEHKIKKVKSFPVGRINYLYLHPLNFVEFLDALDQNIAIEQLKTIPVKKSAHQTLMDLFHKYAIIGGMPEIVKTYRDSKSVAALAQVYESIWETYKNDIEKYAQGNSELRVIKHILNTACFHFNKRIKYQNFGNSAYRSREVSEGFRSLDDAKIIQIIYPTTSFIPPIIPDVRKSPKIQFLDTGILNFELKIQDQMLALENLSSLYKGDLIPHLVFQELISKNTTSYKKPVFWVREKTQASAEVDLLYTFKNMIFPVEIKAGSHGTLRSLHQFIERSNHPYAVRMYAGEFLIEKAKTPTGTPYLLMNLPYYLSTQIESYLQFFTDNY
jgi:uncharacterized protein